MRIGRLIARLLIGGLFIGHGLQKLAGWFGGAGIDGTSAGMEQMDMYPAKPQAIAAGVAETGAGVLLAAGLATPLAATAVTSVMLTAIRKVHLQNGPWSQNGGWEYNAVLIASALAITDAGPGPISLDAVLGKERKGPGWMAAALGAGAIGSVAAIAAGKALKPKQGTTTYA